MGFRTRRLSRILIICPLMMLLALSLPAQSLEEPQYVAQARPGFTDIYNLDYGQAEQVFLKLRREYPEHPGPPLYLAIIVWLRELLRRQELNLDRFLSPGYFTKPTSKTMPPEERKRFEQDIADSQQLCKRILNGKPKDPGALYYLGSSYGILAAFAITIDHSLSKAFKYGNKSYEYQRNVIKIDPEYYDAYLTAGIYQYIVGSLPWYVKPFALLLGYHGSKEQGIQDLKLVVSKGREEQTDAKVLLMVVYLYQNQPQNALAEAESLHRMYPRNYIFAINVGQIEEKAQKKDRAASTYLRVLHEAEEGVPNYNRLPLATFRYMVGDKLFNFGRLDAAREQFEKLLAAPATPERERALSQLRLGQISDLEGKRGEAVEHYQAVLKMQNTDDSQVLAREYLRTPFRK